SRSAPAIDAHVKLNESTSRWCQCLAMTQSLQGPQTKRTRSKCVHQRHSMTNLDAPTRRSGYLGPWSEGPQFTQAKLGLVRFL
ncbi:hypothetical protein K443DRAFT_109806, partial [Laccaria amethystina LaAM-08-1]